MSIKRLIAAAVFVAAIGAVAVAANIPLVSGPVDPANQIATLNGVIQSINSSVATGAGSTFPKNLLDNSNFAIAQRGTGTTQTCGTTTIPVTAYSADRWGCNVNVSSGAGTLETVTSSPSPLVGGLNSEVLYRTSGSLTQPQCAMQEIPTSKSITAAGQVADFSVYLQALSGLSADNGNQANLYVFTGTGTDQGFGTFTSTTTSASVTVATTGIITYSNSLVAGQPVYFTAATIPTGFTANQIYYVSSTNLSTSAFSVATTYSAAVTGTILAPTSAGTTVVVDIPQITPAFTGLAVYGVNSAGAAQTTAAQAYGQALSQPLTITTAWQRYSTGLIQLPNTVTEIAVAVCFNPTLSGTAGSTDGIAISDAQFELLGPNAVGPTVYENRDPVLELHEAQKFYYRITEPAAGVAIGMNGTMLTTTTCALNIQFPETMQKAPVFSHTGTFSTSTWQIVVAADTSTLASTYLVSPTAANTTNAGALVATLTTGSTAGWACQLQGAAGTSSLIWSADF